MIKGGLRKYRNRIEETAEAQIARLKKVNDQLQGEIAARLNAEKTWPDERNLLRALIDLLPEYLFVKDTGGRFVVANKAVANAIGVSSPDDLLGKTDLDFLPEEIGQRIAADDRSIIRSGRPMVNFDELLVNAAGTRTWLSTTKIPMLDSQDRVAGLVGICRDITEHKQAEALRAEQARILEMIATDAPLEKVLDTLTRVIEAQQEGILASILLLDADGLHLRHGAAPSLPETYVKAIDGVAIGPKVGSCGTAAYWREAVIVTDIQQDPLWEDFRELVKPYGFRSCWSAPILSPQGAVLGTFALYSHQVRSPTPAETRLVDMATHIAGIAIDRRLAEQRIHHMAHHDALTGLPNRTLLQDRLSQAILFAKRFNRPVTVAFIDLDGFKTINDSLGRTAGDELLKTIAGRMTGCVRGTDTVARVGSDEFAILFYDQTEDPQQIAEALQRIQTKLSEPVCIGDQTLHVTCGMGLATYPDDGRNADALLMNADAAMHRAKQLGRNNFQFYTPELHARVHERLSLQEGLRNAIVRNEFVLQYQPQVDIRSGRIFGAEALVRWRHPDLGTVPPLTFIPLAEETGLIVPIGDWVLRTACWQNKAWQEAGAPPISVSVNVSARQFREKNWVNRVAQILSDSGLDAQYLELELTESLIMQDIPQAVATMRELQAMGIQLSIDDFGTGYSSLNALKSFPVRRLKIDKSFVRDVATNEDDNAIASAVISLGHKLNLKVIAEGVETSKQLAFLRDNDCDEMQGYYFSKPIEADDLEALLKK